MSLNKKYFSIIIILFFISSLYDFGGSIRKLCYLLIIIYPLILISFKSQIINDKLLHIYFLFIALCLLIFLIHSLVYNSFILHFAGFITATMYMSFWYIFLIVNKKKIEYIYFISIINTLYFIVGILGVIQQHFSRNLFGLINNKYVELLTGVDHIIFRSTSVTGSSQVFGITMILTCLINLDLFFNLKKKKNLIIGLLFFLFSLYSQQKSVVFLFLLYLFFASFYFKESKKILFTFIGITSLIVIYNLDIILSLFRLDSILFLINSELSGRLTIYSDIFSRTEVLIGNGWGTYNNFIGSLFNFDNNNPESFILLLYAESGFFVVLIFCYFLMKNLLASKKKHWPIMIAFIIQFFFVHAALSPFVFPFFLLLFLRLFQPNNI